MRWCSCDLLALQYFRPKKPGRGTANPAAAAAKRRARSRPLLPRWAIPACRRFTQNAKETRRRERRQRLPSVAAAGRTDHDSVENEKLPYRLHRIVAPGEELGAEAARRRQTGTAGLGEPETAAKFGYPLSLYSYDTDCGSGWRPRSMRLRDGRSDAPGELTFDYAGGGLVVKKTFHFDAKLDVDSHHGFGHE